MERQEAIIDYIIDSIDTKIKISEARKIAECANYDLTIINEAFRLASESQTEIKNIVGWLISCIKENWGSNIHSSQKFKDAEYDNNVEYEEIEEFNKFDEIAPERKKRQY